MSYERSHSDTLFNQYTIGGVNLEHVEVMKDLGVKFDVKLKFTDHINEKINKAYCVLGLIKRNFQYISEKCFVTLYKAIWSDLIWNMLKQSGHHIWWAI